MLLLAIILLLSVSHGAANPTRDSAEGITQSDTLVKAQCALEHTEYNQRINKASEILLWRSHFQIQHSDWLRYNLAKQKANDF